VRKPPFWKEGKAMKLATLDTGARDGALVVVNRALTAWTHAGAVAPTLQAALDDWEARAPGLERLAAALEDGDAPEEPYRPERLLAPLPRAYEWVDGSAYLNHILLVRQARKAEPPPNLRTVPLVYQGGSGVLLGPTRDIVVADEAFGCDFEAEVAVILADTPEGTTAARAGGFIRLVLLANDVSLRHLIPEELARGFGFFQGKPATAFSPVAVTPDELGASWRDGRLHGRLETYLNGERVGDPDAGPEMHFSFHELIAHTTRTRRFTAGTILGSGTVSNQDRARGVSCLAERRTLETLDLGSPRTPFLKHGDLVAMEMRAGDGSSLFGRIEQRVRCATAASGRAPGSAPGR
jgi:fumarylacetoacetate (FAA) hydrolase